MHFDWTAETGEDDPVLVVPWTASAACRFVDLRDDPDALDEVAEADAYPALRHALRALNGPRSPVFTAKCDVWTMDEAELAHTAAVLAADDDGELAAQPAGQAGYLDVLWRDRALFASGHRLEQVCHRLARALAAAEAHPFALAEAVIRPALLDFDGPREGYALTVYIKALGADSREADRRWGDALETVTSRLRARELAG